MNTKEDIINKLWTDPTDLLKDVPKMMDEWAKIEAIAFAQWVTPRHRYNPTVKEWQDRNSLNVYTTEQLYTKFKT